MQQVIDKNETEQKVDIKYANITNSNKNVNTSNTTNIKLKIKRNDKVFKSGLEHGLFVAFTDDTLKLKYDDYPKQIKSDTFAVTRCSSTYFIYGPDNNKMGYNKSIHCWSVKACDNVSCYRS